jgi:hypothetical protein
MKVKQLVKALQSFDPELEVGCLHDNGVIYTDEVGVYEGDFANKYGSKMIFKRERRKFVIIGNPGDFDQPAFHDNCGPVDVRDDLFSEEEA